MWVFFFRERDDALYLGAHLAQTYFPPLQVLRYLLEVNGWTKETTLRTTQ